MIDTQELSTGQHRFQAAPPLIDECRRRRNLRLNVNFEVALIIIN